MSSKFDWHRVLAATTHRRTTKLAAWTVESHMKKNGTGAYASYETLAREASLHPTTVKECLHDLRFGTPDVPIRFLNWTRRGRSNHYTAIIEPMSDEEILRWIETLHERAKVRGTKALDELRAWIAVTPESPQGDHGA
jgi:hypothetical protein